jgi:hypothetical protein
MISLTRKTSAISRAARFVAIPIFALGSAIVVAGCLPADLATSSPSVPTDTPESTTLPDKLIAGTQTQQVHLLTPSPGPGTLKPPLPTDLPQATGFQPDPLATPLGAGATFVGSEPISSQEYYIGGQWFEDLDAGNRRIFVGVGSLAVPGAGKPTDQGVVIVLVAKWINGYFTFLAGAKSEYRTAKADGTLHITGAQDARLILESSNGTTFYFDVPSRQFVDSLNAPAPPTVTEPPDPTSIPTHAPPTQGPLPTAYPYPSAPTSLPASTSDPIATATAAP